MDTSPQEPRQPAAEEALIRAALTPEINHRLRSARIVARRAVIVAEAGDLSDSARAELEAAITAALTPLPEIDEVRIALTGERRRRRLIAVGSGKGGVGKSTLTTNLAVALARMGRKVGVIDGDIYGPSQPKLLKTEGVKPGATADGSQLVAIDSPYQVKVLSMGHIVAPGKALAWRGPMTGKALTQLVDADWGDTDLLLIDLPPGTGDVQLSLSQRVQLTGALVVSTPQDVALIDALKAIDMFNKLKTPILGLIENMSTYICPNCGHEAHIFGHGGVAQEAQRLSIPFLGELPLALDVRIAGDEGTPIAASDGPLAEAYARLAARLIQGGMA